MESLFESILDEEIYGIINENEKEVDIITFCESSYYLNQSLHGAEKFILKCFYGMKLDDTKKYIKIRNFPYDPEGKIFTEIEFCKYLKVEGRTNIDDPYNIKASQELCLPCGRRGGKTFLASIVTSYEAYKLIVKNDPQTYYGLPSDEEIKISNIATSTEQAEILSAATKNRVLNSNWFQPYVHSHTKSTLRLRTRKDLKEYNELKKLGTVKKRCASIIISSMACTARGARGGGAIVTILDEIAWFIDGGGNRSGDAIYDALTPSLATFGMDGKILMISSPYNQTGIFWKLYKDARGNKSKLIEPDQNIRMFRLPTWEMNDSISFDFLEARYKRDPEVFEVEYGAVFSTTISAYLKFPDKLNKCIEKSIEFGYYEEPFFQRLKTQHYIAVDPAGMHHGYALCMLHMERKNDIDYIVIDRWLKWTIDDEDFLDEEGMAPVIMDPEVVENYIIGLTKSFRIGKIVYDQYESAHAINFFRKKNITCERTPFSRKYNMNIYKTLKQFIYEERILFIDCHDGIMELKSLQEKRVGKNQFVVEAAKNADINTDDLADVLANAVYQLLKEEIEGSTARTAGTTANGQHHNSSSSGARSAADYERKKRKLHRSSTNIEKARMMKQTGAGRAAMRRR